MRTCSQCGSSDESNSSLCPLCQAPLPLSVEKNFFEGTKAGSSIRTLHSVLFHPIVFFRNLNESGNVFGAISFALGIHWLSTVIKFFLQAPFQSPFASMAPSLSTGFFGQFLGGAADSFSFLTRKARALGWIYDSVPLFLDPFITLFSLVSSSVLLYLGTRILVTPGREGHPDEIKWSAALRVCAYVMATSVLIVIPWIGRGVYALASFILLPLAIREVYRVNLGRAFFISLFPNLFFLNVVALGLVLSLLSVLFLTLFKFSSIF